MKIVEFCNSNNGFMSAILAILSFVLSAVAVLVSIKTANRQVQISLMEKRLAVYEKVQKIATFIERFPVVAQINTSYIDRCSLASTFLYQKGSKEYNICKEINEIKKRAIEQNSDILNALRKEWKDKEDTDELFDFYIAEQQNNRELRNNLHFLFTSDIEKCVEMLLKTYEAFLFGHVYLSNAELDEVIQGMTQVSNKVHTSLLLEKMQQQTLKRKKSVFLMSDIFLKLQHK